MGGPGGRGPAVPNPPRGGVAGVAEARETCGASLLAGAKGSDCKSATSPLP
jgi:hypothetical protein